MRARLSVLVVLLAAVALPAQAQEREVIATTLTVGGDMDSPTGSSLRLKDLGTSGGTYVLLGDASDGGNIRARLLGKSDLPSTVGYTDEAETWSLLQTFAGGAALADGTAGTPGLRWSSDTNTGLYRPGADILGFATGGAERARLSSAGLSMAVPVTTGSGALQLGSAAGPVNPAAATNTLGTLTAPWLSLDVLELRARRFIADETIAYVGGSGLWSRGTELARDVGASDTTIYVRHNTLRYHDFVVLRDLSASGVPQYEVMRITSPSGVPQVEGDYAVSVDRNQDGTGANNWTKGQAVVSTDRLVNVYSYSPTRLSYWGSVLGDRPLLAFNFMTSPAVDLAGTGATATIGSGASHATTAAGGDSVPGVFYRFGSAGALYSGIDPGTALDGQAGTCAISVEVIVRIPDGGIGDAQAYIVQKGTPGSSANHFAVLHTNTGRVVMFGAPNGTWQALTPQSTVLSTVGYYHLVMTWDAVNGGRTYVNGVETGTPVPAPGGCLTPNASTISGNGQWKTGETMGAAISELAIYGYVLSPAQIRAHHEARTVDYTSLQHGPTITGEERVSTSDWDGLATRWAIGQLQGIADYVTPTMGFWAGDETATWVSADATNGFRIGHVSDVVLHGKTDGSLSLTGDLEIGVGGQVRSGNHWQLSRNFGLTFGADDGTGARSITFAGVGSLLGQSSGGNNRLLIETSGFHDIDLLPASSAVINLRGLTYVGTGQSGSNAVLVPRKVGGGTSSLGRRELNAMWDEGHIGNLRPITDGAGTIGSSSLRYANIHLALPQDTAPGYVVVGNSSVDETRLAWIAGFTGTKVMGSCSVTMRVGIITNVTGC